MAGSELKLPLLVKVPVNVAVVEVILMVPPALLVMLPVKIAGLNRMLIDLPEPLVMSPLMVEVPPVKVTEPLLVRPAPPVRKMP